MKSMRSFARQSPAIVISIMALTFSLGTGAGYAASRTTASTTLAWHRLTLINGWKSAAHYYASDGQNWGYPAYAISNGVVYLSGSIVKSTDTNDFAVLPKGARPAVSLSIPVAGAPALVGTNDDGAIYIDPDGAMFFGAQNSDSINFTSLSGVSFTPNEVAKIGK
jgi:hypothetical protein